MNRAAWLYFGGTLLAFVAAAITLQANAFSALLPACVSTAVASQYSATKRFKVAQTLPALLLGLALLGVFVAFD